MNKIHSDATDQLFQAILSLNDLDECYAFFEDLCTIKELLDISQRFEVATVMDQGLSYLEISQRTNVSSATISRVKKCLEYGTGGYQQALARRREEAAL